MREYGKMSWAFSAGKIPFKTTGKEPEFISHDKISVLNSSQENTEIKIYIFYEDAPPVGPYKVSVKARRVRKIRFNDLIDPVAIRLDRNYSCLIEAAVPVVVQFSRLNSGESANAEMSSMAFPINT